MDIKGTVEKAVDKIKNDPELAAQFKKEPVKALEKVLGVDLPDEAIEKVVDAVKAKLTVDNATEAVGKLKGLFGKKDD